MKERVVIEVRCYNCQSDEVLRSVRDKNQHAVFDTAEEAQARIDALQVVKSVKSDNAGTINIGTDYTCPACGKVSQMNEVRMIMIRVPQDYDTAPHRGER